MLRLDSERIDRRQRFFALGAFAAIIFAIFAIQMVCRNAKDVEGIIDSSEALKTLDRLCLSLPQPDDFKLKRKGLGGNSFTTSISYSFWTAKPFKDLRTFYQDRFEADGWELSGVVEQDDVRQIAFRKDRFTVSIAYEGYKTANYSMHCSKSSR